jgi:hypothetical protein
MQYVLEFLLGLIVVKLAHGIPVCNVSCPEVLQYLFVELIVCYLQVLEKKAKDQLQFQTFEDFHKSRRKSSVQTTCSDLPFKLFCPVSSETNNTNTSMVC